MSKPRYESEFAASQLSVFSASKKRTGAPAGTSLPTPR
jgi:hypothetical protein